jgi:hypothetical protein
MKKLYLILLLFVQIIASYGQVTIDPNDLAILISIRDNAPADSPLKTEWADVSQTVMGCNEVNNKPENYKNHSSILISL